MNQLLHTTSTRRCLTRSGLRWSGMHVDCSTKFSSIRRSTIPTWLSSSTPERTSRVLALKTILSLTIGPIRTCLHSFPIIISKETTISSKSSPTPKNLSYPPSDTTKAYKMCLFWRTSITSFWMNLRRVLVSYKC